MLVKQDNMELGTGTLRNLAEAENLRLRLGLCA